MSAGAGYGAFPGKEALRSRAAGCAAGGRQVLAPRPAGAERLMEGWWSSGACRCPAQAVSGASAAPLPWLQRNGACSLLPRGWLPASTEGGAITLRFVLPAGLQCRGVIGGFVARRRQSPRLSGI